MAGTDLVLRHVDFFGNTLNEYENPAGLRWTYQIGAMGPGKCQWTLAESDPGVSQDAFGPKRTDFCLWEGATQLIAGPIWNVRMPFASEVVDVVGVDWLQWLDQPPLGLWDYDTSIDGLITSGIAGDFVLSFPLGSTVQDIIEALLAPLSANPVEQIILLPSYSGSTFSQELSGFLARSSSQTVLSLLQEIAQMGSPYGFDFWADPDGTLNMVGPRRTNPSSVSPVFSFDESNILDGEFTNDGPAATEVLFKEGLINTARYWHKEHQPSIDQYRRWGTVAMVDGGDTSSFQIGGLDEGDYKAQAAQYRLLFPQRRVPLTIAPEHSGFGFTNRVMEAVEIDWERAGGYHRIDSFWWITSQTYYISDEGEMAGEWLCDLTLDQINVPIS